MFLRDKESPFESCSGIFDSVFAFFFPFKEIYPHTPRIIYLSVVTPGSVTYVIFFSTSTDGRLVIFKLFFISVHRGL